MIRKILIMQSALLTILCILTATIAAYISPLNPIEIILLIAIFVCISYGIYKLAYTTITSFIENLTTTNTDTIEMYINFLTNGNYYDRHITFCLFKDKFTNEKAILEKIIDGCFNTLPSDSSTLTTHHNHTLSMIRKLQELYSKIFDLFRDFELYNNETYSQKEHFEINFKRIMRYYGEWYAQNNIEDIVEWYVRKIKVDSTQEVFSIHDNNFFGNMVHMLISDNGKFGGPHIRGQIIELLHKREASKKDA